MTKTTTLWIDNNLVIRWHEKWPVAHTEGYTATDMHADELAQAKAESVPVEYSNGEPVTNVGGKPDSFFEVNGEVEVLGVCNYHSAKDHDGECCDVDTRLKTCNFRKVARLKPAISAMSFTEAAQFSSDSTVVFPEPSLRARILDEFNNITNADNAYQALEWTLDRLNIK